MKNYLPLVLALSLGGGLLRGEANFEDLTSPSYRSRHEAQQTFEDWIFKDPMGARNEVLQVYLVTEDPELRMRLIPILERAYFPPKGYVGIMMEPALFDARGKIPGNLGRAKGIKVTHVVPGTPAALSGLRERDIIVQMDEWVVEGEGDLNSLFADRIQAKPPGKKIRLEVMRDGEKIEVALQLGVLPAPSELARATRQIPKGEQRRPHNLLSTSLVDEMSEFRLWLADEIEKHGKSHR